MRAYLDTSVFLTSIEVPQSNSRLLFTKHYKKFKAVVSYHVLEELRENLKREYGRDFVGYQLFLLREVLKVEVMPQDPIPVSKLEKYRHLVSDPDDLPHIAAYFLSKCEVFVTTNRRLTQMKIKERIRFISPKSFIEDLGEKSLDTPDGI